MLQCNAALNDKLKKEILGRRLWSTTLRPAAVMLILRFKQRWKGMLLKYPPLWWECISDSQRAVPPLQPNQYRIGMWRNVALNQKWHSETHKMTGLWSGCPSHSKESVERSHCIKGARQELDVLNSLNDSAAQNLPMSIVFHRLSQRTRVWCSVNVPCASDLLTARDCYL